MELCPATRGEIIASVLRAGALVGLASSLGPLSLRGAYLAQQTPSSRKRLVVLIVEILTALSWHLDTRFKYPLEAKLLRNSDTIAKYAAANALHFPANWGAGTKSGAGDTLDT